MGDVSNVDLARSKLEYYGATSKVCEEVEYVI